MNDDGYPLINGTIGKVTGIVTGKDYGILGQKTLIDFQSDYSLPNYYGVEIDSNIFKGNAGGFFHINFCSALANAHSAAAHTLHQKSEQYPDQY